MATIKIQIAVNASPEDVWEEMRHIERHVNWMHDAVSIDFLSDSTEGVGTSFLCLTKVGPIQTRDVMTITEWRANEVMGVKHIGLIEGTGTFAIGPNGEGSIITWQESLQFPWWALGPLGSQCASPVLRFIWKRNLQNLKVIIESTTH